MTWTLSKPARAAWAGVSCLGLLAIAAVPLVARAEPAVCDLDASGNRVCAPPTTCATRAACIMGAGTDDETCQNITLGSTVTRECLPDCTTLLSCGTAADCPRINDIAPTCSPVAAGSTLLPSICTWTANMTMSTPLAGQITYCTPPGNHIPPAQITACHRRADDPTIYTTDYFRGDCDGDGCPNGHDTDPCTADPTGSSCTPSFAPFESPFCAPLPAIACTFSDTGLTCGDARPCNPASASILPCSIGTCEDGWSDVPRCRPECDTLFLCATGALPGGGSPPEQCPQLNGATGQCLPLPGSIPSVDGRDGLCIYSDFFDTSCLGASLDSACFTQPDGTLTDNYWHGDCDGDGAPNACDDMICADGGGTMSCDSPAGDACTPSFTLPDAGVDSGAAQDAGTITQQDAATTPDAGNTGSDAATGNDGGVQAGFSGGGGCHCAAAGTTSRPWAGAALAMVGLGLVLRSRRRR